MLQGESPQPDAPTIQNPCTPQHHGAVDEGYELLPGCRALPGEIVVEKWTFGAFASTELVTTRYMTKRSITRTHIVTQAQIQEHLHGMSWRSHI